MPPGGRRGSILVGAEDFSVGLEVPFPFESLAPELAAAGPPDVAAAEPLPEAVESDVPLAVVGFAAVEPAEPVSTGDEDAELEPVICSEPGPNQQPTPAVSFTFVLPPHNHPLYTAHRRRPWPSC